MSPSAQVKVETTGFLDDIEKRVSEIFSAQKCEVEQTLIEKINREKEEAQKRIEAVNQQFAKVRSVLDEHKTVMAELQATEGHLRGEIRGHFERAVNYQKMMENAAGLAGDELEKIGGLNQELEKIRVKAEEEYANIKRHLAGYSGIAAEIPAPAGRSENDVDWNEELSKLRKVRDLLATLRQAEPSPVFAPAPVTAETTAPAAPEAEELAMSLGLVDAVDDGVKDDAEFALPGSSWGEIPVGPADAIMVSPALASDPYDESGDLGAELDPEAIAAPVSETVTPPNAELEAVQAALAGYRRTEPVNNGIELGFYTAGTRSVLDGESFMTAVGKVVDSASQLHAQLSQTGSVKDLFLLKQEILNQQEVMRKVFFRVVRFCDKESGRLPETLSEFMTSQGMKDLIERLTMANWSDPSDFKPFLNELKAMKRAFETRAATAPHYLKSVLAQVEGRDN
jgi:hypothetical protein